MEKGIKDEILNMIKDIENKNSEIEKYLSKLSLLSRNETLKDIMNDIIENNSIIQEIEKSKGDHLHPREKDQANKLHDLVESFILNIQDNPTKKIIYLREFLENFPSISNMDKDVIINSLKDESNKNKLREKMTSLVDIFHLTK
ncbi:MAG: hypothetical protein ACFE8B_08235 [Candidatus Hermodarchaeota archaeon]